MPPRATRRRVGAALAAVIALSACTTEVTPTVDASSGSRPSPDPVPSAEAGSLAAIACSLPTEWLERVWHGYRSDRGAEVQMLPREFNFIGSGLPHVGPWPYVADVPLFVYGPGHVAAAGVVDRVVTVADIAPTAARFLDFDGFAAPDGRVLEEALIPDVGAPRLVVTLIWDAAGMGVLEEHPDAWPYLRSLIDDGAWYGRASIGSSPSSTAQIHATIGTGAFPRTHGLIGHRMRIGDVITTPWARGPSYLISPTLADVYDLAMGNEPIVGEIGTVAIHFGMLGHGAYWSGGDRDLATTREVEGAATLGAETFTWNLAEDLQQWYEFPAYVNDVPGFEDDVRAVDAADGRIDGRWRDNEIEPLLMGFDTPARTPYQQRVVEEFVRREGFGADEMPDLLYLNFKQIDYVSHVWGVGSPEMEDSVVVQDQALERLVTFLDEQVGEGEWVLFLTSDHGSAVPAELSGAFQMSTTPIVAGLEATFDADGDDRKVVEGLQPTQVFIDVEELEDNGFTLEQVAQWILGLTWADVAPDPSAVDPADADTLMFDAAFPSELMEEMPCLADARAATP